MALPDRGQLYVPSNIPEVRDTILSDYQSLAIQFKGIAPAIQPGSEPYVMSSAVAGAIFGLYYNAATASDNTSELTATGDALDAIRQSMGLPELLAAPASGKLIVGTVGSAAVLFVDGTQFLAPSGLRGKVNGNQFATNGASINVIMVDTGSASNVTAGSIVQWVNPPINSTGTATVDSSGLTGGVDDETDDEKRTRILNRRANVPGGGNWAFVQSIATGISSAIQTAFVYPTLGGPSTLKCVVCKAMTLTGTTDYSRQVSDSLVSQVADALRQNMPDSIKMVVQSVANQDADVGIQLSLPIPGAIGGGGNGWEDATQFPTLVNADNGKVTVTSVTSFLQVTVSAQQSAAPIVGQSVMWWDHVTKTFVTVVITAVSGSAGAWNLTFNRALSTGYNNVVVGDLISPSCVFANDYAQTLLNSFNSMGPGENTSDPVRLARASRKPNIGKGATSFPTDIGALQLSAIVDSRDEVTDAVYSYRNPSTPTVPASIDTAPNVLVLRHLAFYPI